MVTLLWPFRKACFSARKEPQRAPPRLHPRGGVAWPGSCLAPTMSNRQMNRKTAALKSPVSYTEKPDRAQESPDCNLHWPEDLKGSEKKKDGREGTLLNKYNHQYHKLFKDIPLEEMVLKACSCALQRDLLIQGRLYISPNWLCFHASLFGKDIKYVFVSLLSRDSVYDVLRRVCTHLQPSSKKSLSVRKFPEDPECKSLEVLIPKMKWRKICPAPRSLLISDSIPCVPQESLDSTDGLLPSGKPAGPEDAACETWEHEEEPAGEWELQLWDSRLLKVIFTLICFLVISSSYLAFRISQLEQQLCSLDSDGPVPGHRYSADVLCTEETDAARSFPGSQGHCGSQRVQLTEPAPD
ncbi:GRAM domain-containing protein 2A isoform X14 [Cavia porcellus]|uniref:GRAM domain-containing protein 2A isoform X14 n=1 Tax=Cavia porcellus TaxID=10141 RepID=UPI002FDF98FC